MQRSKFSSLVFVFIIALLLIAYAGFSDRGESTQTVSNVEAARNPLLTSLNEPAVVAQSSPAAASTAVPLALESVLAQEAVFIELFENANRSVVNITVDNGQGSGWVYDQQGYIVTNNHVVTGAQNIIVSFSDGTDLDATLVGTDPGSDLAVLKVDAKLGYLTALPLADSDELRVGQIVVAIGSPFGLENTLTTGVISGLDRLFPGAQAPSGGNYNIPDIIQTDAAINPGNSGGPLLDLRGRVIGVNTAIESPVRGSSGVGFAVPSNVIAVVASQLIDNGSIEHPWLGISGSELSAGLAENLGLDGDVRGIAIGDVIAGGPADDAGLRAADQATGQAGDVIVGIDDQDIQSFDDLLGFIVSRTKVGQEVEMRILRDGDVITVPVTLGARPAANN
jgi:2-alkenal reductase